MNNPILTPDRACRADRIAVVVAVVITALAAFVSMDAFLVGKAQAAETPGAGTTSVGKSVTCAFDTGTGFSVSADDVTLVNPRVMHCSRGVEQQPGASNLRVLFDPNRAGYSASGFYHTRTGVRIRQADRVEVGGINGGVGKFRDNYRNVEIEGGRNVNIHHLDIVGPTYLFENTSYAAQEPGSIVGVKLLGDYSSTAANSYRVTNVAVHHVSVDNVFEEGISADPGTGDSGAMVRETATVKTVSPSTDEVTLNGTWGSANAAFMGYQLVVNTGELRGRFFEITNENDATFTVADPANLLVNLAANDSVSVAAIYEGLNFHNNSVDATTARVGISFGGAVFGSQIRANTVSGAPDYPYPASFNLRRAHSDGKSVAQGIRVASQGRITCGTCYAGNLKRIPSAYNSVTGNSLVGTFVKDLSFHNVRDSYPTPNYEAANTIRAGMLHKHSFEPLSTDPNL